MNDQEFEQMLGRVMKQDFSAGTETFRETLLKRCLNVLDGDDECSFIDDADLDLLAAAGDITTLDPSLRNQHSPSQW